MDGHAKMPKSSKRLRHRKAPDMARHIVPRHALPTRLVHWTNALAVFILLMSGLNILFAHPWLYWGHDGHSGIDAWLHLNSMADFSWAMLPSGRNLADARHWHFFFAWVLVIGGVLYMLAGLFNGHLRRDLWPNRTDVSPKHLAHEVIDHARLRFPKGEAALRYNSLQKLAYAGVVFILLPLMIYTGLCMAPGVTGALPWLPDLVGGRQSARSIHFICASAIVAFIIVHLLMVLLAGPINHIRSMITGRYHIDVPEAKP
jgi:thiosulfate reductase cytochrome b subunit